MRVANIYIYIYIYIYTCKINAKEYYFFRKSDSHVIYITILNRMNYKDQIYRITVSFFK